MNLKMKSLIEESESGNSLGNHKNYKYKMPNSWSLRP
jgi:hypothetical protein